MPTWSLHQWKITRHILIKLHEEQGWSLYAVILMDLGLLCISRSFSLKKFKQQDKLYCAHTSSEKSYLFITTSQSTPIEQWATSQWVTDNYGHFVESLMSWSSGLWESLACECFNFLFSPGWVVSCPGPLGRLGPWCKPRFILDSPRAVVGGRAF